MLDKPAKAWDDEETGAHITVVQESDGTWRVRDEQAEDKILGLQLLLFFLVCVGFIALVTMLAYLL